MNDETPTLGEFLQNDAKQVLEDRLNRERTRAEDRELENVLRALTTKEESVRRIQATIAENLPIFEIPPLDRWGLAQRGRTPVTWVVVLSDWHLGQKTDLGASGGLFEQTSQIAKEQIHALREKLLLLYSLTKETQYVEKIVWLCLGDTHEGDSMRVSQASRVDNLVARQNLDVFDLSCDLLQHGAMIAPFQEWHNVGGNHDRTTPKPGYAGLGELGAVDTYAWIVGEYLKRAFTNENDPRIQITNWESFFGHTKVYQYRIAFEHGASIRLSGSSYGGVPYYGLTKAAGNYDAMLGGIDAFIMGHLHTPALLPINRGWGWHILNGSLPPATEFTQSAFKAIGRPSQTLTVWSEKWGLISYQPLYLEHPSQPELGSIWRN